MVAHVQVMSYGVRYSEACPISFVGGAALNNFLFFWAFIYPYKALFFFPFFLGGGTPDIWPLLFYFYAP